MGGIWQGPSVLGFPPRSSTHISLYIYIKDVKSSNGTFINGERLSPEGAESEPFELKTSDIVVCLVPSLSATALCLIFTSSNRNLVLILSVKTTRQLFIIKSLLALFACLPNKKPSMLPA